MEVAKYYYIYVIQNEVNQFYTGFTKNLDKRLKQHNEGNNTSTKGHQWKLVYFEAYVSEKYALEREKKLKRNRKTSTFLMNRIRESLSC